MKFIVEYRLKGKEKSYKTTVRDDEIAVGVEEFALFWR